GVEWLPPEKHEQISVQNGKIGGLRTFRYAVRLGRAGRVDLGTVTLPHYDPDARRYRMASAALGVIEVSPRAGKTTAGAGGAAAATGSDEEEDAFASVAGVRSVLRPYRGVGDEGMSPLWLWSLVMVPPLLVLAGGGLWRGAGGVRALRHKRAVDPALLAKRTLRELSGKAGAKDTAAAAARALHYAIEAASGVKARGVMLNELADKLTAAGLSSAVAAEVTALLRDCEALRFEPDADAGKVNGLPQRARDVVAQLLKRR
ncbi:MAG TPA: hypothetical protein ENK23_06955, partial [Sorangium sp.]|nr:hypothetical protein [Sorangium sp.]